MSDEEYLKSKGVDLKRFKMSTKAECAFADLVVVKNDTITTQQTKIKELQKSCEIRLNLINTLNEQIAIAIRQKQFAISLTEECRGQCDGWKDLVGKVKLKQIKMERIIDRLETRLLPLRYKDSHLLKITTEWFDCYKESLQAIEDFEKEQK